MSLVSTGLVAGDVLDTDAQIAQLERAVDQQQVEQLLTIALLKAPGGLKRVQLATMGAPPALVRNMLQLALDACDRVFGKAT